MKLNIEIPSSCRYTKKVTRHISSRHDLLTCLNHLPTGNGYKMVKAKFSLDVKKEKETLFKIELQ